MTTIDPAALNPILEGQYERDYFRARRRERELLRARVAQCLRIGPAQVIFLPNTTAGILSILAAAHIGRACVHVRGGPLQHHPGYRSMLQRLAHDTAVCGDERLNFSTHVAPTTGAVQEFVPAVTGTAVEVIDGAQSFGTALTEELLACADIALSPMHKHFVGSPGLGVAVLTENSRVRDSRVRDVLSVAEHGCTSLKTLKDANENMRGGCLRNQARLDIGATERRCASDLGLEIIDRDQRLPLLCLKPRDDVPVRSLLPGPIQNAKLFPEDNTIRFSYWRYSAKHRDSWVNCSSEFLADLRRAAGV